ncbi:MAG: oxidoreductase [Betaproteobacteria bacterium HGW-Betaproteobacteria-12]|nr:MAG: oxidoreductase [Betaproteobacteria bacterium HGW-Betaproteobacteria-12]
MIAMLEPLRGLGALAGSLAYAGLCLHCWRQARRRSRAPAVDQPAWTVAYASQTGSAEALARQTAAALVGDGGAVRCCPLNQLSAADLERGGRFLFIASTAGRGEAPDNGALFSESVMAAAADFSAVDFAVLALGDREYPDFCAFGRRLDAWLVAQGARRCFDRIDVDRGDPEAIARWQAHLGQLAGALEFAAGAPGDYRPWQLLERRHLNPGSAGNPVFELLLAPPPGMAPTWDSGDLAQVLAPTATGRPRDYSIASLPTDGLLRLLVRVHRRPGGEPGAVSGWLTQQLAPGDALPLRIRPHRPFQLAENRRRPLICIGNGVGLAGLRGHLAARIEAGVHENWLIFGERNRGSDFHYGEELQRWAANGCLQRLDTVFSREGGTLRYVQEALAANGALFRAWVAGGAAVYVCGSRSGMGEGVDQAIRELLGGDDYRRLLSDGRYCRDVF